MIVAGIFVIRRQHDLADRRKVTRIGISVAPYAGRNPIVPVVLSQTRPVYTRYTLVPAVTTEARYCGEAIAPVGRSQKDRRFTGIRMAGRAIAVEEVESVTVVEGGSPGLAIDVGDVVVGPEVPAWQF